MFDPLYPPPRAERGWLSSLSPSQQLGYGCLTIAVIGAMVMYCAGTASIIARPMLLQRSTPTNLVPPTLVATPTQAQPTFINLPGGTLLATPTQAPIPTREPATITPTVDLTNPAPTPSINPRGSPSPNGKVTATVTRRATATVTPR